MERVLVKEAEGARKINRGLSWSLLMKGGKGHSYRTHYGEKAVEEEESLKGEAVVPDAVGDARQHDRLDVFQGARLQRRIEAAPLEEVELAVVEDAVVVQIADLEDARQRRLRFRRQQLGLGVEERTSRVENRLMTKRGITS